MQSSVSRNLAILREAGFVQDRKEGTSVYFSARQRYAGARAGAFSSRYNAGSRAFLRSRAIMSAWTSAGGAVCSVRKATLNRWPAIGKAFGKSYFDDRVTSLAIEKLLPRRLTIADIGCGTGTLSFELARLAEQVIGIDLSKEMLRRARAMANERAIVNVEFREGDALKLPLSRASVDAAFCVMVLHFLPDPERAIAELCRITRPGGSVILVDLVHTIRRGCANRWRTNGSASIESLD